MEPSEQAPTAMKTLKEILVQASVSWRLAHGFVCDYDYLARRHQEYKKGNDLFFMFTHIIFCFCFKHYKVNEYTYLGW